MKTQTAETKHIITRDNVDSESFYNCTRLATITGFANPPAAIKELNLKLTVLKDSGGNILRVTDGQRQYRAD